MEGEAGGEGEEEFSWGEEEEEGEDPAAPRTASGISVGMKGAEKGGIGVSSSSLEEEEVDGVMRCSVVVPLAKEDEGEAGSTSGDMIILGPSTGEEAIIMRGPGVSVVLVVLVVEPCVGKRYGRPPMYKVPKARRSK